jgi:GST-like protein
MSDLFPKRWTVEHPDRLQLYSLPTPNGQKLGVALEELGVPYEAHAVNIMENHQFDDDYKVINPNAKIPTLIDPDGPDGKPLAIMESGAILLYLADKYGKLIPEDARGRSEVLQWLFFQVGSVGPMFGQFGHFYKYAKGKTDSYGEERYTKEVTRLLEVINTRLEGREWLAGEMYTIADIATFPWINGLDFYEGKEAVGYEQFGNVIAWMERCMAREAVQRGITVAGG